MSEKSNEEFATDFRKLLEKDGLASDLIKTRQDPDEGRARPKKVQENSDGKLKERLDLSPEKLPELRHEYVKWIRGRAADQWIQQHMSGSAFVAPPHMRQGFANVNFDELAAYYAQTWERARLYSVSSEMTTLAYRTQMSTYRLTLDNLPSPQGVVFWQNPIGSAEDSSRYQIPIDLETGEIKTEEVRTVLDKFRESPSPVIAASWRYDENTHQVWVVFYTDHLEYLSKILEDFPLEERARGRNMMAPIAFEREQSLPLDRTLQWFDSDAPEGERIPLTARSYAATAGPTEEIRAAGRERDEEIRAPMTQMVKTLISTWLLMDWKIAHREEVPAPRAARKRMIRESSDRNLVEATAKVQVIKLGAPLKRRSSGGSGGGKWKVRAIVGPYIRNTQYVPAHDRYDHSPRLIEPYIAGPEGAPLSNADKVFLLDR